MQTIRQSIHGRLPIWVARNANVTDVPPLARGLMLLDTPSAILAVLEARAPHVLTRVNKSRIREVIEEYLHRYGQSVVNSSKVLSADAAASSLCAALENALRAQNLAGNPVRTVVAVRTGPLVRYDSLRRRIDVNVSDPSIEHALNKKSRALVSALLAACVTEVNRALTSVTDAEERRVLLAQLYGIHVDAVAIAK